MADALFALLEPLRKLLKALLNRQQGASVQMTEISSGVDLLLHLPNELDLEARESLGAFAQTQNLTRLSVNVGGYMETVAEVQPTKVNFSGVDVTFPPGAFLQATLAGEKALVADVKHAAIGCTHALDLFAGLGTFTFALAGSVETLAVEGDKKYCDALETAIKRTSEIKPTTVEHRDLFRRPLTALELQLFDLILFDPPRAGAKEQCREIANSNVPKIIAISCNSNSFARDARILVDGGYKLQWLRPVDQFLWSHHLELVALFEKEAS